jgi:coniferyl-aldehyde dehydrogenase
LAELKAAHLQDGAPSYTRIKRLDTAIKLLVENEAALCDALAADFGHRSKDQSAFTDIVTSISALKNAKKHLRKWMKPEKRGIEFPFGLLGAKNEIRYQPKGVVGIVAPWNFPVAMVFAPLAGILAAGNRAMVKPSEFTPKTSKLMEELVHQYFEPDVMRVFNGEAEVGAEFTALPFDHIIFTGSTGVGRHVMRAAAENLTPVTLELGGKSPTVVGKSADMQKTANRIMHGKVLNAGQICTAPDWVLIPEGSEQAFVTASNNAVAAMFPDGMKHNDDYTSVINQRHYDRLQGLIKDAQDKGGEVVAINPKDEDFSQQPHHHMPPHLILNPTDDMRVMQEEIFGPVMPVKTYSNTNEAIADINGRPRPLALYYFGEDKSERDKVIDSTTAGGVTINDTIFHVAQEELPFGGVGPSGMGSYHGIDGFKTFSHAKGIHHQTGLELIKMLRPPYDKTFKKQVSSRIKL